MSKAEKPKTEINKKSKMSDQLKQKDKVFVLFYATWCPFSQRFLPVFQEYAKTNPNECISIIVDEEPDIFEDYGIEYYPTVILFNKGKVQKRIDAEPGVGLSKKQLKDLTEMH